MASTIVCTHLPVDSTQRSDLEKFFGSSTYLLIKEMVVAKCIEAQVESMNAALYPANEHAEMKRNAEQVKAVNYNTILDLLDELSSSDEKWFIVQLDHK